jgi:DNA-binding beta-propeller fold protein YncE
VGVVGAQLPDGNARLAAAARQPLRFIQDPYPSYSSIAVDPVRNEIVVTDENRFRIIIQGPKTPASFGNHLALAYPLGASGDTAPTRIIRGSPLNTPGAMISNPFAVAYDTKREEILVTSCVANPRIAAFERMADKNALPVRTIQGANSKTNRTMHAISYDEVNDEIVVPSRAGQAIMFFRGSANGDVAPKRILNPPYLRAQQARVDPIRNLLIVAGGDKIWVFDRTASGREAQPTWVVGGPASGLRVGNGMTYYPPTGMILINVPGAQDEGRDETEPFSPEALASDKSHIAVFSIDDRGDVPPRWTIAGPKNMLRQPRGVTLDPKNKTVIVSDKYLNGVLTYSFPEIFSPPASQTARAAN